jgi:1,4-dihydroxy-2-naphthoate octaprenyltransferase
VLTGEWAGTAFIASLVPFFLVNDLLLLNQFPDVEADQSVHRRHYPILVGRRASSIIYIVFLFLANLAIVLGVGFRYLPGTCLIGLIPIIVAIPVSVGVYRHAEDTKKLILYMGWNVVINITTPVLMAIGLFVG